MNNDGSSANAARSAREARLAQQFVMLADTLVDDFDVMDFMDLLTTACLDVFEATAVGLLLVDQRGGLQLASSSSEESRLLELFQLQAEEGPCLDCIAAGVAVTVDDLAASTERWPRFCRAASLVGYTSVHALPLRLRSEVIGGLSLFRIGGVPLSLPEQQIAQALADVATIGILQQRSIHRSSILAEQLQTALNSRIVIEQAKGVLAEHGRIGMDEAYRLLRTYSRNHNLKLSEVAETVATRRMSLTEITSASPK